MLLWMVRRNSHSEPVRIILTCYLFLLLASQEIPAYRQNKQPKLHFQLVQEPTLGKPSMSLLAAVAVRVCTPMKSWLLICCRVKEKENPFFAPLLYASRRWQLNIVLQSNSEIKWDCTCLFFRLPYGQKTIIKAAYASKERFFFFQCAVPSIIESWGLTYRNCTVGYEERRR